MNVVANRGRIANQENSGVIGVGEVFGVWAAESVA
jgi:hypothetical protein